MIRDILHRLRSIFRHSTVERELDDELRHHLDLQADRYLAMGWTRDAAMRQARLDIGGFEQVKEEHRDVRGTRGLEDLGRDARVAFRMLRRVPLLTATAIITVGLGVGVNTLVFSVVEGLVLRPLPIEKPGRVWFVQRLGPFVSHSFPFYTKLRDRNRTFAQLAGYRITMMQVETPRGPAHAWGYLATGSYFRMLGVKPARGRLFQESDDLAPGSSRYAVLSYDYWQMAFDGDEAVVGATIRINRQPYSVLGVAPKGFYGTEVFYRPAIWVPMMMQAQIEVGHPWLDNPNTANTWVIGRLADGTTPVQATDDLNAIARRVAVESGTSNDEPDLIRLTRPGLIGDAIGGPARVFGLGLLALAGLVLLATCANLAGGLAARSADRQREMAIRVAVGAGRGRLMRQLLTETLVLVVMGAAVGTTGAALVATALSQWQLPVALPVQLDTTIDWNVGIFAVVAAVMTVVGIGIGPALRAAKTDPHSSLGLRDANLTRKWPLRDVLVSAQVAICVLLVSGSLLAGRGLMNALRMPLGMSPGGVMTASFDLGLAGYSRAAGDTLRRRILERLRVHPGVQQVAYGNSLPLNIDQSTTNVYPADRSSMSPRDSMSAFTYQVSPEFFGTLGIRFVEGRSFTEQDTANSQRVAIVNEALAKRIHGAGSPIGRQIRFGRAAPPMTIVGVVETGKYQVLTEAAAPAIFEPMLQVPNTMTVILVRSASADVAQTIRQVVRETDPALPLMAIRPVEEMLGYVRLPMQAAALTLGAFGSLAAMLAATGIYGVVAYAVSRRRRDLAIRVALGAQRRGLIRLVLQRTFVLVAIGTVAGVVLTFSLRSTLASLVYLPAATSPWSWVAVVGFVAAIAAGACAWPMFRALRINPATALAAE
ncbi:MAG TPA: ADOP family duplicated permease [Vicinamibacterales bacterium]|jgi:predicted permease|nr:ADOP family duplicated permease [Vicinamibacterales bacterium]